MADPNLNPKKRVATQLVRLEKKMLNACLQAAVDLINQLPDHTMPPCPAPYAPLLKWKRYIFLSLSLLYFSSYMFAYCIHLNLDQLGADNIICAWIVWNKKLLCCPRAHGFQMRNINQVSGMEPPHIAFDECFHE